MAKRRAAGEWATEMTEFWCPCRMSTGPSSAARVPPATMRRGSQNCTERSCSEREGAAGQGGGRERGEGEGEWEGARTHAIGRVSA